jgi:CRP/FNR family transcriptional regulator
VELSPEIFPFFAQLTKASQAELNALSVKRALAREPVLSRGDSCDGAYLVLGGALRVFYITRAGREATLYYVERGNTCVLALTSTLGAVSYPAWVEAGPLGAAVARIPSALFQRMFEREQAFRAFVFQALSSRVFELMQALEEAGSVQVEQRVASFLLRRMDGEGNVRMSQTRIAAELGTAREVVFRALRELSDKGVVRTARLCISVRDAETLRNVSGKGAA